MKILNHSIKVSVYQGTSELDSDVVSLLKAARAGAQNAYAPYSHFKVGAAILLNNSQIITGNNQENAAYPSGLCAERVAAFYASAQYPTVPFSKLAIVSIHPETPSFQPIAPCGGCRQVLLEYEDKFGQEIEIILASETDEIYVFKSVKDLLPFSFNSGHLVSFTE
jgi:cytidine deaminase, homotetrameric